MLIAKKGDGTLFSVATEKNRAYLDDLRKIESFYCPCCNENVQLKLGERRIYHFSHLPGKTCTYSIEPESHYHMSGKLQIYNFLTNEQLDTKLEPFLPEIRQRPDILVSFKGKMYAIEFQCSSISSQLYQKRTQTYLTNGYIPIWILGANLLKRTATNTFSISNFTSLFMRENNNGSWSITYYCPNDNSLIKLNNIFSISTQQCVAHLTVKKKENISFPELINSNNNFSRQEIKLLMKLCLSKMTNYKQYFSIYNKNINNPFVKTIYRNNLSIQNLPPIFNLPLPSSTLIYTSPLIWQTYIYIDNFHNKGKSDIIYFEDILNHFKQRIANGTIVLRNNLFFKRSYYYDVVKQYLMVLVKLKVLSQLDYDAFRVNIDNDFSKVNNNKLLNYYDVIYEH